MLSSSALGSTWTPNSLEHASGEREAERDRGPAVEEAVDLDVVGEAGHERHPEAEPRAVDAGAEPRAVVADGDADVVVVDGGIEFDRSRSGAGRDGGAER